MAAQLSNFGKIFRFCASTSRLRWPDAIVGARGRCITLRYHRILTCDFHSTAGRDASMPVKMPKLSPTMETGSIVKWYKKEGDAINPGDVLCDVETDKATVALDIEEEGILAKIIMPENSKDIQIGALIAVMVEEGDDWQNAEVPADGASDSTPLPAAAAVEATPASSGGPAVKLDGAKDIHEGGHLLGPAVKNLLELYPLSLNDVHGTGRNGAVLKGDILKAIKDKSLKPQPKQASTPSTAPSPTETPAKGPSTAPPTRKTPSAPRRKGQVYEDLELTGMRRTIAKRLTESKSTIPHSYSTIDCTIDRVIETRRKLIQDGVKLSLNDFVIKATAMALRQVPQVNASFSGETVTLLPNVDISVAVATPNGLITPIVRGADLLGLEQISRSVKELSQKARDGKLKPDEFIGGSFSISNLGMFGITEFTAVINPPQACILAVGTSQQIFDLDTETSKTTMRVTISSDSRVVDETTGARFLVALKQNLEHPELMPVGSAGEKAENCLDLDSL